MGRVSTVSSQGSARDEHSDSVDTVLRLLDRMSVTGEWFETVVLLQPTSPLRTSEDMIAFWRAYVRANATSAVSLTPARYLAVGERQRGRLRRTGVVDVPGEANAVPQVVTQFSLPANQGTPCQQAHYFRPEPQGHGPSQRSLHGRQQLLQLSLLFAFPVPMASRSRAERYLCLLRVRT